MGFFSTKKVYVSSTAYNLAGDYDERVNYLKSSVLGAVVGARKASLSTTLTACYLNSSGCRLKNFQGWAKKHYFPVLGDVSANFYNPNKVDADVVKTEIEKTLNTSIQLQTTSIGLTDYTYWAEQRILVNRADQLETDWSIDYNDDTGVMTLTYTDGQVDTFTPSITKNEMYIYASYTTGKHNNDLDIFIYKRHSGNANLDAQFGNSSATNTFYPPIPFRLDNQFISETYMPELYEISKKAFKRATGTKYSKVADAIADNESLKDIDYAYAIFGVSLNTQDLTCRKYLYTFFNNIFETEKISTADFEEWQKECNQAGVNNSAWATWMKAQSDPLDPAYGTDPPDISAYPDVPSYDVHIQTSDLTKMNYNIQLQWAAIASTVGTGIKDSSHTVGDLWFTVNDTLDFSNIVYNGKSQIKVTRKVDHITLYWQKTATSWSAISIWGLSHHNRIYGKKSVDIDAVDALSDTDESGFIIPLEESTFKALSLLDATQMTTECCYIIFNCYKVVKKKWYQTGIFKIILFAAIIAVAVFTAGAGTIGLLGSNLAVGSALGLTGTTAVMVGALANTIAAIVAVKLITLASEKILGKTVGDFIATIISTVALQIGSAMASGESIGATFSHLATSDKIIAATDAVKGGMSVILQEQMKKVQKDTERLLANVQRQQEELNSKVESTFGVSEAIKPLDLTQDYNQLATEGMGNFLARTLMTASDVISFQQDNIHDMFDYNLSLPYVSSIYNQ